MHSDAALSDSDWMVTIFTILFHEKHDETDSDYEEWVCRHAERLGLDFKRDSWGRT